MHKPARTRYVVPHALRMPRSTWITNKARHTTTNADALLSVNAASDAGIGTEPRMLSTMIFSGHGCRRLAAMLNSVNTSPASAARCWPRISDHVCGQSLGDSFILFPRLRQWCQIRRVLATAAGHD